MDDILERLSELDLKFAHLFLKGLYKPAHPVGRGHVSNAVAAYRLTWGRKPSDRTTSSQLLGRKPLLAEYIRRHRDQIEKRFAISLQKLERLFTAFAFSDISEYMEFVEDDVPIWDKTGEKIIGTFKMRRLRLKDFTELSPQQRRCIESVKQFPDGRMEFKLVNKIDAAEILFKSKGGFLDDDGDKRPLVYLDMRTEQHLHVNGKEEPQEAGPVADPPPALEPPKEKLPFDIDLDPPEKVWQSPP